MKKLIIAAMAASIILTFASCGDSSENKAKDATTTTAVTAAETEAVVSSEENSEETAESEGAEAGSEAEETTTTTTAKETETAAETEEPDSENEETDVSEAEGSAESEAAETSDVSAADTEAGAVLFTYEANSTDWLIADDGNSCTMVYQNTDIPSAKDTCTMVISCQVNPGSEKSSMAEIGPNLKGPMVESMDVEIDAEGVTTFNGYDAYYFEGKCSVTGYDFKVKCIFAKEDNKLMVIVAMAYLDSADAIQPKMQEVLDSVRFK